MQDHRLCPADAGQPSCLFQGRPMGIPQGPGGQQDTGFCAVGTGRFLWCLPVGRAWRPLSSSSPRTQNLAAGPTLWPAGHLPRPTLLSLTGVLMWQGGYQPTPHLPCSSPLGLRRKVVHHPNFRPPGWVEVGPGCACDPGGQPRPLLAAWCPCTWLLGRQVLALEPGGLCHVLLGPLLL